jgi:UDP-sulfoquinovose synthase
VILLIRRRWDEEVGLASLVQIALPEQRICAWCEVTSLPLSFEPLDLTEIAGVREMVARWQPDAIVHFGEQPPAPYSMIDAEHAIATPPERMAPRITWRTGARAHEEQASVLAA